MNPLFFLHGFMGSAKSWDEIRHKLNFKTKAIDIPGHGENFFKEVLNSYTFKNWNDEFLSIINKKKLNKINLCGYSMGGRLALSFANSHPEKIHSLILVSTSAGIKNNSKKNIRLNEDFKLSKKIKKNFHKFIFNWQNLDFFSKQKYRNPEAYKLQHEIRLSNNPIQLALSLKYLGVGNMPNYWNKLSKLNFPVLIICGNEDKKYCNISQKLNLIIKDARLEIINNSGHAPQIDQTEIFIKMINDFIKR